MAKKTESTTECVSIIRVHNKSIIRTDAGGNRMSYDVRVNLSIKDGTLWTSNRFNEPDEYLTVRGGYDKRTNQWRDNLYPERAGNAGITAKGFYRMAEATGVHCIPTANVFIGGQPVNNPYYRLGPDGNVEEILNQYAAIGWNPANGDPRTIYQSHVTTVQGLLSSMLASKARLALKSKDDKGANFPKGAIVYASPEEYARREKSEPGKWYMIPTAAPRLMLLVDLTCREAIDVLADFERMMTSMVTRSQTQGRRNCLRTWFNVSEVYLPLGGETEIVLKGWTATMAEIRSLYQAIEQETHPTGPVNTSVISDIRDFQGDSDADSPEEAALETEYIDESDAEVEDMPPEDDAPPIGEESPSNNGRNPDPPQPAASGNGEHSALLARIMKPLGHADISDTQRPWLLKYVQIMDAKEDAKSMSIEDVRAFLANAVFDEAQIKRLEEKARHIIEQARKARR